MQNRKLNCTQLSESIARRNSEVHLHNWEKFKLPNKSCLPVQSKFLVKTRVEQKNVFLFYASAAKPVDPRIYISSKLCDSYWVSINDKKQWEHLNSLQLILADLMAHKDFNQSGVSKMLDEVDGYTTTVHLFLETVPKL